MLFILSSGFFGCNDDASVVNVPSTQQNIITPSSSQEVPIADQVTGGATKNETDGTPTNVITILIYERVKIYSDPFYTHYVTTFDRLIGGVSKNSPSGNYNTSSVGFTPDKGTVVVGGDMAMFYWHDGTSACKYFYRIEGAWSQSYNTAIDWRMFIPGNSFPVGSRYMSLQPSGTILNPFDQILDLPVPNSSSSIDRIELNWQ